MQGEGREHERWIGVDLDGTLAHYDNWDSQGDAIGEPVPAMLTRVLAWLEAGKTVKIFTARACDPKQKLKVREWLVQTGLGDIEITNVKDFGMIELWDDRAVRVQRNTGLIQQAKVKRIWQPRSNFGK